MNHQTRDVMIGVSLVLNVLLAGVLLYDYTLNDSVYTIWVLAAYFAYTLVFLFMWGLSRRSEAAVDAITTYVLDGGHAVAGTTAPRAALAGPAVATRPAVAAPTPPVAAAAPALRPAHAVGPFTYGRYTLYTREVTLKNGGKRAIYFFAKGKPKSGRPAPKPADFHVGVNERTGLPFLKRGPGADGEDLTPEPEQPYRPQCGALTEQGHQCRNSARADSKYCASHFGYQPPTMAKAAARDEDTLPRVRGARDTLPSVRKA